MDAYVDLGALGSVLLASILGGAGLVAAFATGLVGLSIAHGDDGVVAGRGTGLAVATIAFAVVLAGVALGLYAMLQKPS